MTSKHSTVSNETIPLRACIEHTGEVLRGKQVDLKQICLDPAVTGTYARSLIPMQCNATSARLKRTAIVGCTSSRELRRQGLAATLLSLLHRQPCFCNCKEARRQLQSSYLAAASAAACSMNHNAVWAAYFYRPAFRGDFIRILRRPCLACLILLARRCAACTLDMCTQHIAMHQWHPFL